MFERTHVVDVPSGYVRIMGFNGHPNHFSVSWKSRFGFILDVSRRGLKNLRPWGEPHEPGFDAILLRCAEEELCERSAA